MPAGFWIAAAAVLGLIFGSFVNAAVYRIANKKPGLWTDRSRCIHTGRVLPWHDLVPVFSWLWLCGRSRFSRQPIGAKYPIVEAFGGLSFGLVAWQAGTDWLQLATSLILTAGLVFIAAYDVETRDIPDRFSLPLLGFALAASLLPGGVEFSDSGIGLLVCGGFFAAIFLAGQGHWMGGGDVRLAAILGAWLGWQLGFLAIFTAALIGTLFGIILITTRRASRETQLPFGPYLAAGAIAAFAFGQPILAWYLAALGL